MRRYALLCLLSFAFVGCTKDSPEDAVKSVVRAAMEGANEKRVTKVVENALDNFEGPRGADLRDSRRLLTGYFLQQGWLRVFEQDLAVQIEGDVAHAQLEVIMARGKPVEKLEDVLPKQASKYRFELDLEKTDGDWKFRRAKAEQLPF